MRDRLNPDPRHLPDNTVPFERVERREPQRWWERAKAGALYGIAADGTPFVKDTTGRVA